MLALLLALAGYLAVAAAWAWAAFPAAVQNLPQASAVPLSPRQVEILLQVEDPDFYHHSGLSVLAGQGLATITSSLARSVYLGEAQFDGATGAFQRFYRGVFDCCKKIDIGRDVMALVLDRKLGKPQQLAAYSALVYMGTQEGRQVRGFGAAALSYYGKPLDRLSEQEFVGLVAMIKAPNLYHPVRNPAQFVQRLMQVNVQLRNQ
ncbi:transglycosylase domain-containing protein [Pseudoduganella sp. R-32]|uniref:transglycosylase domain-containing protein n=1 Tax=Pseudoduganella sp. R-32 TaxID=3404061 RepID=UPI003CF1112A